MLIKATRLHPSVPLQMYVSVMVGMVVSEVVVNGMVVVEAAVVVTEVVVGLLVVVDLVDMADIVVAVGIVVVVVNVVMVAITEATVRWISFLALSLSSIEGHCQSSPPSSTLTSVTCTWPLAMLTDPGADRHKTDNNELNIKIMFEFTLLLFFFQYQLVLYLFLDRKLVV